MTPFDFFGAAVDIHEQAKDTDNTHLMLLLTLLNDAFIFEKGIIKDEDYNPPKRNILNHLNHFVYLVTLNTTRISSASWWNL